MSPTDPPTLFESQAARYAAARPRYPQALAEWIGDQAPTPGLLWDAGTGSGQFASVAAGVFDRVVATDASPAQLARAPEHPSVDYRTEPAEAPSLAVGSVDAISAAAAAHWFDLPAFYAAVYRVARPGAFVALFSYGTTIDEDDDLQAVIDDYIQHTLAPWWSPRLARVASGYRALPFPFAEVEMPSFSACSRGDLSALQDILRTWSAAQTAALETGRDPVAQVADRLARAWRIRGAEDEPRTLRWPVFGRAGRVQGTAGVRQGARPARPQEG